MWEEYAAKHTETEKEKVKKIEKKATGVPDEVQIDFKVREGADIVIINENKGNFVPLFLFQTEDVQFTQQSGTAEED